MKVLFLDIDGVCNSAKTLQRHRGVIGIDPYMAFLVGKIKLDTGCEVVLSSSWRKSKEGIEEVKRQVCELYDVTPSSRSGFRGEEVGRWIVEHLSGGKFDADFRFFNSFVEDIIDKSQDFSYAILDDDADFYEWQPLFKTEWEVGITQEIAERVTRHLNGEGVA